MMSQPPRSLVQRVERLVPGAYSRFINTVEHANQGLPVVGTSWWRTRGKNASVGGQTRSQHLLGLAIDLVYATPQARELGKRRMRDVGLTFFDEGDHVHVQAFTATEADRRGLYRLLL